jgi:hypothetical protein
VNGRRQHAVARGTFQVPHRFAEPWFPSPSSPEYLLGAPTLPSTKRHRSWCRRRRGRDPGPRRSADKSAPQPEAGRLDSAGSQSPALRKSLPLVQIMTTRPVSRNVFQDNGSAPPSPSATGQGVRAEAAEGQDPITRFSRVVRAAGTSCRPASPETRSRTRARCGPRRWRGIRPANAGRRGADS